jgi:DNA-directed RNA polymerase specialized sigma24 family protein
MRTQQGNNIDPPNTPDPHYAAAARACAKFHVARARRCVELSVADCEDLEQEMVLRALLREPQFDPTRASARTFAELICNQSIWSLVAGIKRDRLQFVSFDPSDAANDASCAQFEEALSTEDDAALHSHVLDWERACATLPQALAELAALLIKHQCVREAKSASGLHRSSFYRRMEALKMHLRMFGIRAA